MKISRSKHGCGLVKVNGGHRKVVAVGGQGPLKSADIYDVETNEWTTSTVWRKQKFLKGVRDCCWPLFTVDDALPKGIEYLATNQYGNTFLIIGGIEEGGKVGPENIDIKMCWGMQLGDNKVDSYYPLLFPYFSKRMPSRCLMETVNASMSCLWLWAIQGELHLPPWFQEGLFPVVADWWWRPDNSTLTTHDSLMSGPNLKFCRVQSKIFRQKWFKGSLIAIAPTINTRPFNAVNLLRKGIPHDKDMHVQGVRALLQKVIWLWRDLIFIKS